MKYYIDCLPLIINIHPYKQYRFFDKGFCAKKVYLKQVSQKTDT